MMKPHDDDGADDAPPIEPSADGLPRIRVRRMHRRDINRVWEFLLRTFREVNRQTVEYQRPRSKQRFIESYDDEGVVQLLFDVDGELVGYAECALTVTGTDNWVNPRYFENRDMRPMYVEELAAHPAYQGRGVGSFMLEQLEHLARLEGCTHLVLEVAENNQRALKFYRKRNFSKLDASLFLARRLEREPELLPPRTLAPVPEAAKKGPKDKAVVKAGEKKAAKPAERKAAKPVERKASKPAGKAAKPAGKAPKPAKPAPKGADKAGKLGAAGEKAEKAPAPKKKAADEAP